PGTIRAHRPPRRALPWALARKLDSSRALKTSVNPSHNPLPTAPPTAGAPLPPRGDVGLVSSLEPMSQRELESHLAKVRLGIASSLFTALRMKHADTASHSLRVSLNTASWMLSLGMSDEQRDVMEVAALLHDVGKIGVPDSILLKPGAPSAAEARIMDQHRQSGVETLRNSCNS